MKKPRRTKKQKINVMLAEIEDSDLPEQIVDAVPVAILPPEPSLPYGSASEAEQLLSEAQDTETLPGLCEDPIKRIVDDVYGYAWGVPDGGIPNEELPAEPFYPHWTDRLDVAMMDAALKSVEKLGYRVILEDASQQPVEPGPTMEEIMSDDNVDPVTAQIWENNPQVKAWMCGPPTVESLRLNPPTGFVKHDAGKPRFSLVPPEARLEIAKVFTHGAKKYPPHNYRKGTEWSRYMDALHRHMNDFELGQNVDEESGLLTLAHVAACAMILISLQKLGKGTDDRA